MPLDEFILNTVNEKQPKTVEQLMQLVQEELSLSKEEIMKHIVEVNNRGKLNFEDFSLFSIDSGCIFLIKTMWYWVTIILVVTTSISIGIPETSFPLVYIRYLLGSIFILFLPGYTLIKVVFPTKKFDITEHISLSMGISLTIVPIIGLIANYTPWGITTASVTGSLLITTFVIATLAVILEYYSTKQKEN